MTGPSPWPLLALLVVTAVLPLLLRPLLVRRSSRTWCARTRIALTVATLASGAIAAAGLVQFGRELAANPWTTLVLDWTPIRERLADATASLVRDEDIDAAILEALAADDLQLARALERMAMRHGRELAPATVAALSDADGVIAIGLRQAADLGRAALTGEARTTAGAVTSLAIDLTPVGDLRDIARESGKWAAGSEVDGLILGLATAGLAATVATVVAPPAGAPALVGKAVMKAAVRTGRAGSGLIADLRRTLGEAVDLVGMRRAASEILVEPKAAARFVRGEALSRLRLPAAALGEVASEAGPRTAIAVVRAAERLDDLPVLARVTRVVGKDADDALMVLGKRSVPALRLGRTALRIGLEIAVFATTLAASLASLLVTAAQARIGRAVRTALRPERGVASSVQPPA